MSASDTWTVAEAKAKLSEVIEKARKTRRAGNLAEFFAVSPLRGSAMRTRRRRDRPRKVDL